MNAADGKPESAGMEFNKAALEPLFMPWEAPKAHRQRAAKDGEPPKIVQRRRPSPIAIANNLRAVVRDFRDSHYAGVSETSRELLNYWFATDHPVADKDGVSVSFRYYFCQREALETLIYLYEAMKIRTLSGLTGEFLGRDAERAALGIDPAEDQWAKYAFKVATGAGKTKIMSLAIVWSYFHSLREPDSDMARHFVIVAPNLTVFERLKEDFGNGNIFDTDPLIPTSWRGDWHMSVVLQDEASGAATGGVVYLTNIHRLYDLGRRRGTREAETHGWAGPAVSRASALDTGAALRERITSHKRLMVLNDEAHHVWDPDSAWNEAISFLNEQTRKRNAVGLVAQLDFSATPKDDKGILFKHIIVDTPLGEAVDGGIVKTPIIGRGDKLVEQASDNAGIRYQHHLLLGYKRWLESRKEWEKSGKKPLMFVMCDSTEAADRITRELNGNPLYAELNHRTINLHTNLKGKIKTEGKGANKVQVFVESEKEISDEDLKALRELSRQLDDNTSPYQCIVSVLMLREGWDVRNVTVIVPLRPYSSQANILPEQTLGRGLRRMTSPGLGMANEMVTVVEHPSFVNLYKEQLAEQGLFVEEADADRIEPTTITIFPDEAHKDTKALDLLIPRLTPAHRIVPILDGLTLQEVEGAFARYKKLPLGEARQEEISYEGRHLITNELIERMKVKLPLLDSGFSAVSFYREELETACGIQGIHAVLAPLIQKFLEEVLFVEKVTLFDPRLCSRLAAGDVREHIRAIFIPLIRSKITTTEERLKGADPVSVCSWRPFQVTHSARHPAETADKTPFNLVPCNRDLEVALAHFTDHAPDVAAFCKNAGPQCLRIDYLGAGRRLAFYTPDFLIRKQDGNYVLVETKGREDVDVPAKARAATAWCKSASTKTVKWAYLYVPQGIFDRFNGNTIEELVRTCAPAVGTLLKEEEAAPLLPFEQAEEAAPPAAMDEFISADALAKLPKNTASLVSQAIQLFRFYENKTDLIFSPVFTPLLGPIDRCAQDLVFDRLVDDIPKKELDQRDYFAPYMQVAVGRAYLSDNARRIQKLLVYNAAIMPIGVLKFCLEYAESPADGLDGVFASIRKNFRDLRGNGLLKLVGDVYDFRNTYVAHQDKELKDVKAAREALKKWVELVIWLENLFLL
jgi:type III restriction enzyme